MLVTGTGDRRRLRPGALLELQGVCLAGAAVTRVAALRWVATRRRLDVLCGDR